MSTPDLYESAPVAPPTRELNYYDTFTHSDKAMTLLIVLIGIMISLMFMSKAHNVPAHRVHEPIKLMYNFGKSMK
jgi:hypothetical protein